MRAEHDPALVAAALRERGAAIAEDVVAGNAGRWESASAGDLHRIEAVARAVVAGLLDDVVARLEAGGEHGPRRHADAVLDLFGLEPARARAA